MGSTASSGGSGLSRGRVDKRQAILDAAFTVFARRGYTQACVQEIAEEARVAKPTVYSHLNDKETLFRHTIEAAADTLMAQNLALVERLRERTPDDDLRVALADLAQRLLRVCCDERARALRWLTYAQMARFPDLIVTVQERTAHRPRAALADRLARLSLAGSLRPCDPEQAAEHFFALLTGPLESRSRLGTRRVPAAELRGIADAAVDVFLRAYGSD
ncbi:MULTISPECIES: TetR/AcrR family transcriptional regulator [unclassified Streptomyces]|uniref:TetR/AcrR family transcriptional regulator n=1 Tax=unclassified Streptomyces TaxID=2593676 RepID=UPI00224F9F90|nr:MULTISPECIES: TetR/AcrR family transcriptional regulator [unclassified Streptomyces]MCX5328603.1 TetR/AcrR family transcriptional regulator [Streptomyces sp. NBC_00140]MCX5358013.1 TetR/AcrR family transcriptional regulator [Streptomyces sp. NBC_00124]